MISIIIPSYNNLIYLKLCIESIKKNSSYNNEILVHVNEGTDGTIEYLKDNSYKYTLSPENDGLCIGCNKVSKLCKYDLILYSHDDMYFCPEWDVKLINEVKLLNTKKFYLSSIMINGDPNLDGHLNFNAGDTAENFDEKKLLDNYKNLNHKDFQGSTWAPHLIHKEIWNKVGGFSEEFSPGAGSDPDLNMKLWNEGVRIFKCLGSSKVYHFGSITIRKKDNTNFKKNLGSKAKKLFLVKWGISIDFFKKYYLKSGSPYIGPLNNPNKNFFYYFDLIKIKIFYSYYFLISNFKPKK
jgi:glycosyltransferase involved in cell wall biosynthesis